MQNNEQQLIKRILKGDKSSFAEMIEKYQRLVAHIVYTNVKNTDDRDDICQEVFIKVYVNLATFRFKSKLSTWIGQIAYNECMNYFAKNKLVVTDDCLSVVELNGMAEIAEQEQSTESNPHKNLSRKECGRIIELKIMELPGRYQAAVRLFHLDGLSYREIGAILGLSMDNVKVILFRARTMLREKILTEYRKEDLCP